MNETTAIRAVLVMTWLLAATAVADAQRVVRLDALDLARVEQGWGKAAANRSVDGKPMKIGDESFESGVGTHAASEIEIALKGGVARFTAKVGVDAEVGKRGSVGFEVRVDGVARFTSGVLRGGDAARSVDVDLTGAAQLTLTVTDGGDGIDYDHADWADARFTLTPTATADPAIVAPPPETAPEISTDRTETPQIRHPRITGATPGRPFLFRVPTTGVRPMTFSATDLPEGLSIDASTGVITGSLKKAGEWTARVSASNARGGAVADIKIVGGEDKLTRTPPMGWNSWNVWGTAVDDAKVRAAADWMVSTGLRDHGFEYVNIDDGWERGRDEKGEILTNEKFPDMKALADYVHSKGLKLGIYSSPGPKTCAGYEGSYRHEIADANAWARWGVDYVKYDWCSYGDIAPKPTLDDLQKPYRVMREALNGCGRDIVFSLCQYGMGSVWTWGGAVGGNLWRTTGDITDTWGSLSSIGFSQDGAAPFAGPGRWNDPDMLVVGRVGWGPTLHPTKLTMNEQITHMTLWSLLAAPLLIGCDLTALDPFTSALLMNDDVIAVDQDPLGKSARRVHKFGDTEAWSRPLADGSIAVGLFNRGSRESAVECPWSALGVAPPITVQNLWLRRPDPAAVGDRTLKTSVPRHGAAMFRLVPVR